MKKIKKKSGNPGNKNKVTPKKKSNRINKSQNAFHSANYRRRKNGLPELTFQEYCQQAVALDSSGRFHPRKQNAYSKAVSIFGKEILKEKKKCIKCLKKKPLIEFSMRYSLKSILNVCKDCEQVRQRKYWKSET